MDRVAKNVGPDCTQKLEYVSITSHQTNAVERLLLYNQTAFTVILMFAVSYCLLLTRFNYVVILNLCYQLTGVCGNLGLCVLNHVELGLQKEIERV